MPFYEYRCQDCGKVLEKLKSVDRRDEEEVCPDCGGDCKRKISAPGLVFKGSGWYVTDYSGKKKSDAVSSDSGSAGQSPSSEGKPEGAEVKKSDQNPSPSRESSGTSSSPGSEGGTAAGAGSQAAAGSAEKTSGSGRNTAKNQTASEASKAG